MHKVFTLISVFLVGCVAGDIAWHDTGMRGPYTFQHDRARVFEKCGSSVPMSDVRPCKWAFVSANGKRIEIYGEIVPSIDSYLKTAHEYRGWPNVAERKRPPYKFVVLTIEPLIVVGLPVDIGNTSYCSYGSLGSNCMSSAVIVNGYSYFSSLPISSGTVWFSPGTTSGLLDVPTGSAKFVFPIQAVDAKLVQEGSEWKFVRNR